MPASKTPRSFGRRDGGQTGASSPACGSTDSGRSWQPGAGGMCLHTIVLDRERSQAHRWSRSRQPARFAATMAARRGSPINRGLKSNGIPRSRGRGRALRPSHRNAPGATRPCCTCKSIGMSCAAMTAVSRGTKSAEICRPISVSLSTCTRTSRRPIYVVPIKSDSEHYPIDGRLRVYRSRTGGDEWEELTNGLPQANCYVNVLRDAMAVDSLDSCGIYFGTTGGQVYVSADSGESGGRSCTICRPCSRSKSKRCRDSRRAAGAFARAGAGRAAK